MTPAMPSSGTTMHHSLSQILATRLEEAGMTQRAVALQIGVSPQTIANVLKGARPDVTTLHKLSQFLGEPIGLLMKMAGVAPSVDLEAEQLVSSLGDDWATLKMLSIMRRLPRERRKRVLQMIEIYAEDAHD